MKEQIIQLGPQRHLLGILCLPESVEVQRPVVVIPNTGVDHRVGPNRIHVEMARVLADAGYASLRLDLSGLGDSDLPSGQGSDSVRDLRLAFDELQRRQLSTHFVVFGLCSGAHDAFMVALVDERVVGAAFLDGYAYQTPGFRRQWWMQRLMTPHRWRNAWVRLVNPTKARPSSQINLFQYPPLVEAQEGYRQMMARDMALFVAYTGEVQNEYNHQGQLYEMFPTLRDYARLDYHYLLDADHTLSRRASRRQVLESMRDWLFRHFPADSKATA